MKMSLAEIQANVVKNLKIFRAEKEFVEVRILKTKNGVVSGYYNDFTRLANDIGAYIGTYDIYFTLNPLATVVQLEEQNTLNFNVKQTTKDSGIKKFSYLLIDLDPERKAGISSTDDEKKTAYVKAKKIFRFLKSKGWFDPIVCDSGNGYHLLYPIDLANEDTNRVLLKQFLQTLNSLFPADDGAKVDTTTYNASRIVKLYGTIACKGESSEERPHRISKVIHQPKVIQTIPIEKIKEITKLSEKGINDSHKSCDYRNTGNPTMRRIDVEDLIKRHNLGVYEKKAWEGNSTLYKFKYCPFNPEHDDWSFCIIQFPDGAIAVKCHHDSCSSNDWKALKKHLGIAFKNRGRSQIRPTSDQFNQLLDNLTVLGPHLQDSYVQIPLAVFIQISNQLIKNSLFN